MHPIQSADHYSIDRVIPASNMQVRFSIGIKDSSFFIKAAVTIENITYLKVPITNYPEGEDFQNLETALALLKKRAIDYIAKAIFILPSGVLTTYNEWRAQKLVKQDPDKLDILEKRIEKLAPLALAIKAATKKRPSDLYKRYSLLGDAYYEFADSLAALLCYRESIIHVNKTKDLQFLGESYGKLAIVYQNMGDYDRALKLFTKQWQIAKKLEDECSLAKISAGIGAVHANLGNIDLAILFHKKYLAFFEKMQNTEAVARAYTLLGRDYAFQGNFTESITFYENALRLTKDPETIGDLYVYLGETHSSLGNYTQAVALYGNAKIMYQEIGCELGTPDAGLGNCYEHLGSYLLALEHYKKALSLKLRNRAEEGVIYSNKGNAYKSLSRTLKSSNAELGVQLLEKQNKDLAVDAYQKALHIFEEIGKKDGILSVCHNLAEMHVKDKEYEEAYPFCDKALALCGEIGDRSSLGFICDLLGDISKGLEDIPGAWQFYQQSLMMAEETKEHFREAIAHAKISLLEQLDDLPSALDHLHKAIEILTLLEGQIISTQSQQSIFFLEKTFRIYRLLETILLAHIDSSPQESITYEKIFAASDLGRSRVLVSILGNKLGLNTQSELDFGVVKDLSARLQTTFVMYSCSPFEKAEGWCFVVAPQGAIHYIKIELASIRNELEFKSERPRYLRGNPFEIEEEEPSDAESLISEELRGPGKETGLERKEKESIMQLWYNALIAPIAHLLPERVGDRVTIIPDSIIHELPFAVFTDFEGKTLLDKYTLTTAPSIETLLRLEAINLRNSPIRDPKKACIAANAEKHRNLTGSEKEAMSAREFFTDPTILIGDLVTKSTLVEMMPSASFIHFACHGSMLDHLGNPFKKNIHSIFQGALSLSEEEFFADDLAGLSLNADVAILSACESGKGTLCSEGVVGLSHAFLAAGASSVIATRWKIPDAQTERIINAFYQFYFRETGHSKQAKEEGRPFGKAEALREAMLSVKQRYPANLQAWGSFFLQGLLD